MMATTRAATTKRDREIVRIAREILRVETLATRNSDALDFHDVAVWQMKAALEAAYEAGRSSAGKTRTR